MQDGNNFVKNGIVPKMFIYDLYIDTGRDSLAKVVGVKFVDPPGLIGRVCFEVEYELEGTDHGRRIFSRDLIPMSDVLNGVYHFVNK